MAKKELIHITKNHTGKMEGMQSISTSVLENEFCKAHRAVAGSICEKCFASSQMRRYTSMQKVFAENTRITTESILPDSDLPILNAAFFRFESFGDIANVNQVANYFNICRKNPYTRFALWTKNPLVISKAIRAGHAKPENLIVILSSLYINKPIKTRLPFVDKVFTVYDKETADRENVTINCGARHCLTCKKCYLPGETVINELLK